MKAESKTQPHTYTVIPDTLLEKETLSLNAKVILGKILNLCKNCKEIKISNQRLSQLICADIRTVQRAKKELVELGLITIIQEEKGRGNLADIQVHRQKVNGFLGYNYFETERIATPVRPTQNDYYKNKRK